MRKFIIPIWFKIVNKKICLIEVHILMRHFMPISAKKINYNIKIWNIADNSV